MRVSVLAYHACVIVLTMPPFRCHRAGGVIIKGYGNRIVVDNTLDQRLKLLEQEVRQNVCCATAYPA